MTAFVLVHGDWVRARVARPLRAAGRNAGRTEPVACEAFNVNPAERAWAESLRRTYVYAGDGSPSLFTQFHPRVKDDPASTECVVHAAHDLTIEAPETCARPLADAAG